MIIIEKGNNIDWRYVNTQKGNNFVGNFFHGLKFFLVRPCPGGLSSQH